ncbi:MAG: hypothetical protein MI739_13035 [Bacteroidales bacterium]|nr:hypothetical protein [Bacteroidales bacterium]
MNKIILVLIGVLLFNISYGFEPVNQDNSINISNNVQNITISKNYQQFKFQLMNIKSGEELDYTRYKGRRVKNPYVMLYAAGGLAVATIALILLNNPDNYTSNSALNVNLGIAAGGTVACGLFVTKYLIDRKRY